MPNHTIIISDLHIDDWTDRKIRGKTRMQHFFEFLAWCEQEDVGELIINGDLMDMPPYKGQCVFQPAPCDPENQPASTECISRPVVERLLEYGSKRKITYVFGNHDIGLSGFRCEGPNNIAGLQSACFSYPNYRFQVAGTAVLVEHGHFYDPFLYLYLRDLAQRTYMPWQLDDFDWGMQRRDPETGKRAEPGLPDNLEPRIQMDYGNNAYQTVTESMLVDREHTTVQSVLDWSKDFADNIKEALAKPFKREIWWAAALYKMNEFVQEGNHPRRLFQLFGHTHRPFVGESSKGHGIDQNGVECFYLNSGGWTEGTDEGWYIDINTKGKLYLQDWINESEEDKQQKETDWDE